MSFAAGFVNVPVCLASSGRGRGLEPRPRSLIGQWPGRRITPSKMRRIAVTTAEIRSDEMQPRRLLKKKNN